MQIFPRLVLLLPAADRELVFLDRDLDLVLREAATARVMRNRSGSPPSATIRSILYGG